MSTADKKPASSSDQEENQMESTKTLKTSAWRRAVLLAGIGVVSAGSVAGVSFALTSSSTPAASTHVASTTATSSAGGTGGTWGHIRKAKIRQVLRRAVSGQIELATKNGFVTVDFNRGAVTSISSSSITVLRADGQHVTDAVTAKTHMPKAGTPTDGRQVVVVSENGNALYVLNVGSPAAGAKKTSTPAKTSSSNTSTT
jgi:hypothetical protein